MTESLTEAIILFNYALAKNPHTFDGDTYTFTLARVGVEGDAIKPAGVTNALWWAIHHLRDTHHAAQILTDENNTLAVKIISQSLIINKEGKVSYAES
jgi:hypothetical protein